MARPWFPSLIWLLAVLLSGKLSAQLPAPDVSVPDSWVGTYSGTGLVLEIRQNASGGLAGSITFQNKRYVAIVMAEGDKLEGAFRTADDFFPYQATRNGNELRFVTGNTEYRLRRTATTAPTPASPVAGRGSPAPPPPSNNESPVAAAKVDANGSLADSTPLAQRWLNKLRGKLVRQFWASQGMSSDKRHWLNADGTYAFKSSSMVSVDASGASALSTGRDATTGRWSIRDVSGKVFLEVRYNNGNVRRMAITEDNRNWYLNGEKAFAVNPE